MVYNLLYRRVAVLSVFILVMPLRAQQILDEMQILDISDETSIRSVIIRDPEQALLVVKTQISNLHIRSNNIINELKEVEPGTRHIVLAPGTHRLSFQAEGFISIQQRFYFNPKDVKGIRIRVISAAEKKEAKNTGLVFIETEPDSAQVYLNDQFYGTTPYTGRLLAGRYRLTLSRDNFVPLYDDIVIKPYENNLIKEKLERATSDITTASEVSPDGLNVAVLDFSGGEPMTPSEILTLTDRFRGELVQVNAFVVLDRNNMESILKETGFQFTECTTKKCAVEAGKILNVQKMIAGRIGLVGQTYTLDIMLIDVASNRIEKSLTRDLRGEKDELLIQMKDIASSLSENYLVTEKPSSSLWWWIAGGGVVAGAAIVYIILSGDEETQATQPDKLPGADGIWPPD